MSRMFVCGDIHGCVDALRLKLRLLGFNEATDTLYALGDLVDRGPQNVEAIELLDQRWFKSIKGNHEELMLGAFDGDPDMLWCHLRNGGAWFAALSETDRARLAAKVRDLPLALTVTTPSGRKIGLVHADFPGDDWDQFVARLDEPSVQEFALWSRERIGSARYRHDTVPIVNVDHVYFGHTPMDEPLTVENMSWIDTGCFATGRITVEELL